MSSKVVDRYLDREGILEEGMATAVKADEVAVANKRSQTLGEDLALMKEAHAELERKFDELEKELGALRQGKGILGLLMELARHKGGLDKTPSAREMVEKVPPKGDGIGGVLRKPETDRDR